MIPSSTDITYFRELAQSCNVSRAAERLGISQPSLSLALQRLEAAVGAELFIRSKRGMTLTRAGTQLLAHTRDLLQTWEDVRTCTLDSVNDVAGIYTLGCHASVARLAVPTVLPALMRDHTGLSINLQHDLSRKITSEVIAMRCDLGIVVNPVPHPDLVIHKLCRDEVTLWTRAKNPTAAQDITAGTAVLVCDPDLLQTQSLLKDFKKRKISFARTISSGDLEVITDLTAHGAGIGVLPGQPTVRAAATLARVPNAPAFYAEHALIYRVENRGVKAIQAIAGAIRAFYSDYKAV